MDISYEDELALKRANLMEILGEYAGVLGELHAAPVAEGYRNKMEFAFGDSGTARQARSGNREHVSGATHSLEAGSRVENREHVSGATRSLEAGNSVENREHVSGATHSLEAGSRVDLRGELTLGIRKKRSFYEVASPENCVLICEDFKRIVAHVTDFFRDRGETFFHRKRHTGALRHLVLRRGEFTGEILVLLSATSTLQAPLDRFVEGLLALPLDGKIVGIMHAENDGVADAVKNENIKILHGRDYYYEKICGLTFKVSAFSFFQTNSRGAEVLYGVVAKFSGDVASDAWASGSRSEQHVSRLFHERATSHQLQHFALDLYCGTGTIAQVISPLFERVAGVEIIEEAILAARENAAANDIKNCEFFAGDVFENLTNETPCTIILDPPRDGLHPKALAKIAALGASRVIYVACKPKSFVRDLPAFIAAGYEVQAIEAVDMFPRTPHVEAVALLRRADT
ncbi:MAG: methyltransferase [Defluviitaleaceae bacterium]|nr:methyltransferase [Defluviitaleaceae bacterium]